MALLVRIILSSTKIGDTVLDPFAGTGTALIAAKQMGRNAIGIEIDSDNVKGIQSRLKEMSQADNVMKFYKEYSYTENLKEIWGVDPVYALPNKKEQPILSFASL